MVLVCWLIWKKFVVIFLVCVCLVSLLLFVSCNGVRNCYD